MIELHIYILKMVTPQYYIRGFYNNHYTVLCLPHHIKAKTISEGSAK